MDIGNLQYLILQMRLNGSVGTALEFESNKLKFVSRVLSLEKIFNLHLFKPPRLLSGLMGKLPEKD